jgi:hypothetical protein
MELERYTLAMGRILVNFHALEVALRHFFKGYEARLAPPSPAVPDKPMHVGQVVPLETYSAYDSLNGLIKSYNAVVVKSHAQFVLEATLVELRDALAHGRVWGTEPPLQLLKFSKPTKGGAGVTVLQADTMDETWLEAQNTRVLRETAKVFKAGKQLQPTHWK